MEGERGGEGHVCSSAEIMWPRLSDKSGVDERSPRGPQSENTQTAGMRLSETGDGKRTERRQGDTGEATGDGRRETSGDAKRREYVGDEGL